jgi:hypothetical protein
MEKEAEKLINEFWNILECELPAEHHLEKIKKVVLLHINLMIENGNLEPQLKRHVLQKLPPAKIHLEYWNELRKAVINYKKPKPIAKTNDTNLEVGTKLIAIDPCIMKGLKKSTLTVGKKYKITDIIRNFIFIIDDCNEKHLFDIRKSDRSYYGKWFKIEE